MEITNVMLEAAIKRATEAGLFPRHASAFDMTINLEIMRTVLNAALDAARPPEITQDVPVVIGSMAERQSFQ